MGLVDGPAHIEIHVRGVLEEHPGDLGSAVFFAAPVHIKAVFLHIVLGIFQHLCHGDDPFGHQVYPLELGGGGDLGVQVQGHGGIQGLA